MSRRGRSAAAAWARTMSVLLIVLGLAILVRTAVADHFTGLRVGYVVGVALTAAGLARLWLAGAFGTGED